jgi:DNA-binding IclR family transcriptional regulator
MEIFMSNNTKGTQALLKGLAVIDAVGEGDRTLKEIYESLNIPKSTAHRIVSSLVEQRYIREVKGIGFVLGTKLIQLGSLAQNEMPLKEIARPFLLELARITKDTVHLGIKDEDEIFYLDKFSGKRAIEMRSSIGDRLPISATGIGKALMLDMPSSEWHRLIGLQVKPEKRKNIIARMDEYSAHDYSFDLADNVDHLRCVAVPIRNNHGNIIAAISIASIEQYMPKERMLQLIPIMKKTALNITNKL